MKNAPWGTVETAFDEIHSAARERNNDKLLELISAGVDIDLRNGKAANGDGGNTALWFACQGLKVGGSETVQILINASADVNAICEHGRTPLHIAAAWGNLGIVKLLVASGANLNIKDSQGMTPQQVAVSGYISNHVTKKDRVAVIQYLSSPPTAFPEH